MIEARAGYDDCGCPTPRTAVVLFQDKHPSFGIEYGLAVRWICFNASVGSYYNPTIRGALRYPYMIVLFRVEVIAMTFNP